MSIEVENVVSGYSKDIIILHGISIYAEKGKVTSIIGPNGAGKSTLLKTIYGFLKPRQGTIVFDGRDITGRGPHTMLHEGLAYVPQTYSVFPRLTVKENLEMGTWIFRKDKKRIRESINKIYEIFPILKEREKVLAKQLSGGEHKMIDIGRVLMSGPKTVLMDEPTAGLAPKKAEEIYQKIREIGDQGITLLLVDQNIRKAVGLSDCVYVVKMGKAVNEGPSEKIEKELRSLMRDWLL